MTTSNNTIQAADKDIHEEFERRYAMDADDPASAIELGHFVDGWRACISRQRTLAMGAPFMYGIAAPDGTAYIEEFCVSGDRGELQTEVVDQLNRDSLEGSYSVTALFRHEYPETYPKLRDALSGMVAIFARGTPPGESPTIDLARSVLARAALASAEPLVRYCPGCGSIGPVPGEYHDCCPDGDEARMIPAALAAKCRDTFKIAVKALLADAAANDSGTAQASGPVTHYEAGRANGDGTYEAVPLRATTQPTVGIRRPLDYIVPTRFNDDGGDRD